MIHASVIRTLRDHPQASSTRAILTAPVSTAGLPFQVAHHQPEQTFAVEAKDGFHLV